MSTQMNGFTEDRSAQNAVYPSLLRTYPVFVGRVECAGIRILWDGKCQSVKSNNSRRCVMQRTTLTGKVAKLASAPYTHGLKPTLKNPHYVIGVGKNLHMTLLTRGYTIGILKIGSGCAANAIWKLMVDWINWYNGQNQDRPSGQILFSIYSDESRMAL